MLPALQNLSDMVQVRQSHGGMEFRIFAIDAYSVKPFRPGMAKVPHVLHLFMQCPIPGKYSSAFHGMKHLGGMKAGRADIPIFKNRSSLIRSTKAVSRIINDF